MSGVTSVKPAGKRGLAIIAEDSSANAAALNIFVKQSGFEVKQFPDGQSAWSFLLGLAPAEAANVKIIFSDFMMPNMDGYELLKSIRSKDLLKDIPFVFCSAIIDPKMVKDAMVLSQGYIVKPATLSQVQKKIEQVLGTSASNPAKAG